MYQFRLRDLLALTAVIAVAVSILVLRLPQARIATRRNICGNNLRNIGIALQRYHASNNHLPAAMSGSSSSNPRLSGLVSLLPLVDQQALYEQIMRDTGPPDARFAPLESPPHSADYLPWRTVIPRYRCPEAADLEPTAGDRFGDTNYTFCIGDSARNIHPGKPIVKVRGMFSPRVVTGFDDVTDGLSNTICMGEIANALGQNRRGQFVIDAAPTVVTNPIACRKTLDPVVPLRYAADHKLSELGRGGIWADGAAGHVLVNTILPPNDPSCGLTSTPTDGIFSAGSYHVGGGHVLMGDGAVQFISDSIDTGDLTATPPERVRDESGNPIESPYGVWGQMGTRSGSVGPR